MRTLVFQVLKTIVAYLALLNLCSICVYCTGKTGQQGNQAGGKKRKLPSNCLPAGDHESAEKPKISMNLVRPNDKKGTGVSLKLVSCFYDDWGYPR